MEALDTLNRWLGRGGLPIEDYLRQWEASCAELRASGRLPARLKEMLRITYNYNGMGGWLIARRG